MQVIYVCGKEYKYEAGDWHTLAPNTRKILVQQECSPVYEHPTLGTFIWVDLVSFQRTGKATFYRFENGKFLFAHDPRRLFVSYDFNCYDQHQPASFKKLEKVILSKQ